jgi:hypothetical protein
MFTVRTVLIHVGSVRCVRWWQRLAPPWGELGAMSGQKRTFGVRRRFGTAGETNHRSSKQVRRQSVHVRLRYRTSSMPTLDSIHTTESGSAPPAVGSTPADGGDPRSCSLFGGQQEIGSTSANEPVRYGTVRYDTILGDQHAHAQHARVQYGTYCCILCSTSAVNTRLSSIESRLSPRPRYRATGP